MNDNIERDSLSLRPLSLLLAGYQRPVFSSRAAIECDGVEADTSSSEGQGTSGKDAFHLGHYKDVTEIGNRT